MPRFDPSGRPYLGSHPWISFTINTNEFTHKMWMLLGEALSKCEHIAGVPLPPAVAEDLHRVYLAKGVLASAAIEGNTLSEEEVRQQIDDGKLDLPESQEYLAQETQNILDGANMIMHDLVSGEKLSLDVERIKLFHKMILRDLPLEEGLVPGEFRTRGVTVGGVYAGVPASDAEFLIAKLCDWLETSVQSVSRELQRPMRIVMAIVAHLYIAWIHPFLNGNGRTARLVEVQLLLQAGLPTPACHLLSNYYNRTRQRYYEVLRLASRNTPYSATPFIEYALTGLVEELREQLKIVMDSQRIIVWRSYVHEVFEDRTGEIQRRQREVALALPWGRVTPTADVRRLTPLIAEKYATRGQKAITRDLNVLEKDGLIVRTRSGVMPNIAIIEGFLPLRKTER